jgi:Kef-type K+ transport system membrane component KefB
MKLCDKITPPIFMLFFVASGADLKLSVLPAVGAAGVIYIVFRVFGKMLGATLGAVISKADKNIKKYLGPALIPQAGVAIGLSLAASSVLPEHAKEIRTIILCGTLVYELVGPAIAKTCLKKAGEIKE